MRIIKEIIITILLLSITIPVMAIDLNEYNLPNIGMKIRNK